MNNRLGTGRRRLNGIRGVAKQANCICLRCPCGHKNQKVIDSSKANIGRDFVSSLSRRLMRRESIEMSRESLETHHKSTGEGKKRFTKLVFMTSTELALHHREETFSLRIRATFSFAPLESSRIEEEKVLFRGNSIISSLRIFRFSLHRPLHSIVRFAPASTPWGEFFLALPTLKNSN
jgi:hypothetical protein